MVKSCCVYKCTNRYTLTSKASGISFFRFPKDKKQRRAWVKAINRDDWSPNDNSWICSEHFEGGWHGYDPSDHNYAPTVFSYKKKSPSEAQIAREARRVDRQQSKVQINTENFTANSSPHQYQAHVLLIIFINIQ
jgi:hypothetical protein